METTEEEARDVMMTGDLEIEETGGEMIIIQETVNTMIEETCQGIENSKQETNEIATEDEDMVAEQGLKNGSVPSVGQATLLTEETAESAENLIPVEVLVVEEEDLITEVEEVEETLTEDEGVVEVVEDEVEAAVEFVEDEVELVEDEAVVVMQASGRDWRTGLAWLVERTTLVTELSASSVTWPRVRRSRRSSTTWRIPGQR